MKPTLVVNPVEDEIFAAYADLLLDHGVATVGEMERRLRTIYPRAVVHPRELSGEPILIWYLYRDGHWEPTSRRSRAGVNGANGGSA
jgi:hypothetical protein